MLEFKFSSCSNSITFQTHSAKYSKLAKHTEIQFIPHPRKWIHHERWNDEIQHIPETKKDFKNLDRSSDWAKEFKI